jgi:hypothetical protein
MSDDIDLTVEIITIAADDCCPDCDCDPDCCPDDCC